MKKYYENYEDYDAAVAQATGIIKHLRKTFDMDTIRMAFREVLDESRKSNKKKVRESREVQYGPLRGTDPDFWDFLEITFNGAGEYDSFEGNYDDLVDAVNSFKEDWIADEMGDPRVLRYTANKWLAMEGRSICSDELNGHR